MTVSAEAPAGTPAPVTRAPDFYIVGHAKSGTTALYEMLRSHPQIYMPDLKETRFFARELHPRRQQVRRHPDTLEEYLSLFEHAKPGQVTGEASPSYLRSPDAAARIAEQRPDARIIAIFREPASFIRSLHLQLLQAQVETEKDLHRALALEGARRRERESGDSLLAQGLMYRDHIHYTEQLRRFHSAFTREHVLVLIYDDFRADNEGTVKQVLRFLGVDAAEPIEVTQANPSVAVRSPRLNEAVRSLYMGRGRLARGAKSAINAITPRRLRHDALGALRRAQWAQPGEPDEEVMLELRRHAKGEVVELSRYLERDLVTLWGYDRVE